MYRKLHSDWGRPILILRFYETQSLVPVVLCNEIWLSAVRLLFTVGEPSRSGCLRCWYSLPTALVFSERELKFRFAICRRPSVCLSSVCRLSVTFVHPTQAIEIFEKFSSPFGTLAICWHLGKILRRSSRGNPSVGELNKTGVAEYSDFGPIERYISETVQDRS